MPDGFTLDIQIYDRYGEGYWAQCRYLVHGYDDSMWTDDMEAALQYLRQEIERVNSGEAKVNGNA